MRATLTITANDLRIFFAKPGNWVGLALLPILFTLFLGFAFGGEGEAAPLRLDVLDQDQSTASTALIARLRQAGAALQLCDQTQADDAACGLADQPLTLSTGMARVRSGESDALIVIPRGYAAARTDLAPVTLDFYTQADATTPDPIRQTLEIVLQEVNAAGLTAAVAAAMYDNLATQIGLPAPTEAGRAAFVADVYTTTTARLAAQPPVVNFVTTGGDNATGSGSNTGGFGQVVPGMGTMYVLFTVLGGMAFLQRERQRGTLQRLTVLPLRRSQILGSKMLTFFTLGMIQYAIVFAVGLPVGLDFGPQPLLLVPVMVAFTLCCTALTFAIAPALANERQASVTAQLLAFTFAALGGAWWPLEIVPEFMQQIGRLSPVAWAMDAFRDLLFYGGSFTTILPEIALLLAAAALIFALGIWRFRTV